MGAGRPRAHNGRRGLQAASETVLVWRIDVVCSAAVGQSIQCGGEDGDERTTARRVSGEEDIHVVTNVG